MMDAIKIKLSICIATYNRGKFIGETLDSVLSQMLPSVELVIVDGASPDNTPEVMTQYLLRYPEIRYFREQVNSGVDRDYDKAVGYAKGEYCWLMTDDDLLRTGSFSRVLTALDSNPDLVVVNAEVKNADFSAVLNSSILKFSNDKEYLKQDSQKFFSEIASYLSFIGGVVINRQLWLERDRTTYYGTLFIHVGVIFQHPLLNSIKVIAEPLIAIRYGNAMWTGRSFEIWMFKWPKLIWSFNEINNEAKSAVTPHKPWQNIKELFVCRAKGSYSSVEYKNYICNESRGWLKFIAFLIGHFPASLANFLSVYYVSRKEKIPKILLCDLLSSRHTNWATHLLARLLRL